MKDDYSIRQFLARSTKNYIYNVNKRKFPSGIDIKKEYELIQQKKSNLTKSQRDAVEFCYNFKDLEEK